MRLSFIYLFFKGTRHSPSVLEVGWSSYSRFALNHFKFTYLCRRPLYIACLLIESTLSIIIKSASPVGVFLLLARETRGKSHDNIRHPRKRSRKRRTSFECHFTVSWCTSRIFSLMRPPLQWLAFRRRDFQHCGHDDIATGLITRARNTIMHRYIRNRRTGGSARQDTAAAWIGKKKLRNTRREFFKLRKGKAAVAREDRVSRCPLVPHKCSLRNKRTRQVERDECSSAWIISLRLDWHYLCAYRSMGTQRLKKI